MRLKKVDISGFKSFSDKTSITFPEGITAIVGPNGCGKSNIVDAMRWVMGEQSLKQLRGKNIEDIIFAGSINKSPVNLAEVSFLLSNENGKAPAHLADFTEIEITRRIYRSGESAYLINRQPCRLKDVQELFATSGMGSRSYSVVQQGNIGAITDADPLERRVFIEEAAGVLLYKARKKEALRKIEHTQQNLDRLRDIISEIDRQRTSLKKQVKAAEKFKYLQSAIRELDIRIQKETLSEYQTQFDHTQKLLIEVQDTDTAHSSALQQLDAELENIQVRRTERNIQLSEHKNSQFELQRKIDRSETEFSHITKEIERLQIELKEGADLKTQLNEKHSNTIAQLELLKNKETELSQEFIVASEKVENKNKFLLELSQELQANQTLSEQMRQQYTELIRKEAQIQNNQQNRSSQKESLKRRSKKNEEELLLAEKEVQKVIAEEEKVAQKYDDISKQITILTSQLETLGKEVDEKNKRLSELVATAQKLDLDVKALRTHYNTLKKLEDSYEGYQKGTKTALEISQRLGIDSLGIVADFLQPEEGYERAIEASVGHLLQYVIVPSSQNASDIVNDLFHSKKGRTGLVVQEKIVAAHTSLPADIPATQRLISHISVSPEYRSLIESLLGHIVVVEDISEATRLHKITPSLYIVTKTGFFMPGTGILIGGGDDSPGGVLFRKQELKQLQKELTHLEAQHEIAIKEKDSFAEEVRSYETNFQHLSANKIDKTQKQMDIDRQLYRLREDVRQAKRQQEMLRETKEALKQEEVHIVSSLDTHEGEILQIQTQINELKEKIAQQTQLISQATQKIEEHKGEQTYYKIRETELKAQLDNTKQSHTQLNNFLFDTKDRQFQLKEDLDEKTNKIQNLQALLAENRELLEKSYTELKTSEETISEITEKYQEIENNLQEGSQKISLLREVRQKTQEKIRELELEQAQRQFMLDNIHSTIFEKYQDSLEDLWIHISEKPLFDASLSKEIFTEKLMRHKKHLERIGAVNLAAMQEFEEANKRYGFLNEQLEDMTESLENLQKLVRKINRITQERFMEMFHLINQKFSEVFSRLFSGGSAQLLLTEPDKPLETGVELMISPPGKKVSRLSLLSGGEKALSAIAFIFSIFLLQPTGFCIMDEIDASLDDVNVARFNELLQIIGEHSQIIMITHNKRSMEFSDMLVGVTMEQKGISKIVSVQLKQPEPTFTEMIKTA